MLTGHLFSTVIRATHTQEVLGEQGRRIRELTSLIQKRFKFPENSVSLYAAKVQNRGLSAVAQCESLRYKLLNGLAVRRACYGVLRFIMESGAKGCEVVVSGKLRAARAKSMKFTVRLHPSRQPLSRRRRARYLKGLRSYWCFGKTLRNRQNLLNHGWK